mmetsp:Transcript_25338/g.38507  ORF Transcript_25338/g.38507 Transcript_25338/m.38507 type:complete len:111 (+) Transcript_25338:314-646(+)
MMQKHMEHTRTRTHSKVGGEFQRQTRVTSQIGSMEKLRANSAALAVEAKCVIPCCRMCIPTSAPGPGPTPLLGGGSASALSLGTEAPPSPTKRQAIRNARRPGQQTSEPD